MPPTNIGRYRIDDRLAIGGMGEVYRAALSTLDGVDKPIALKVVKKELAKDERFLQLFLEEAKVAMSLSHANVVQSFDVGRIDDTWFIAMELVTGLDLSRLLRAVRDGLSQPIPQRHAILIAVEALKGLDYSHRRTAPDGTPLGIVHRDVSPSNVLISLEGEVKIADFGIAKSRLRQVGSSPGRVAGKLPYMAPEQLRQAKVDARTDIYGLGAVLYEMMVGRPPFDPSLKDGNLAAILEGRFPRPRELTEEVPEPLEAIVLRALSLEPGDRYPNCAAMRQELEALAMASGYLLSSSDLADFVRTVSAAPTRERVSVEPAGDGSVSGDGEGAPPMDDPFNAILGRELVPVQTDEPYSVLLTQPPLVKRARTASLEVPAVAEESREAAPPPPERRFGLAIGAVIVAALAALPIAYRWTSDDDEPYASEPGAALPELQADASVESGTQRAAADRPDASTALAENDRLDAGPQVAEADVAQPPVLEGTALERAAPERRVAEPTARPRPTRPRPPSPPVAAQAEGGLLSANTSPWSYLDVDGRRLRSTPVVRHPISAGRHTLRFHNPAEGLERTVTIDVEPGEHERVSFDL